MADSSPSFPVDPPRAAAPPVPRLQGRQKDICLTAAVTFIERGYDATSVNDIAAALGITKAGLYHYISGKESLLHDIIALSMDSLEQRIIEPSRAIADPGARLKEIVFQHARLSTFHHGALTLLTEEVHALPAAQRRAFNQRRRRYVNHVRDTIAELRDAGRIAPIDPTVAAYSVIGIIVGLPRWFRLGGRLNSEAVAHDVLKYVVNGLRLDAPAEGQPAPEPGARRTTRRRRSDAPLFQQLNPRRFKLCMTAARTLVQRGFDATSVNDIAGALGVTKAGLYHYITSKDMLFFEILTLGMDWLDQDVLNPVREIPDVAERLQETVRRHAVLTACNEPWITVLLDDRKTLAGGEREKINQRKRVYLRMVREMIETLQAAGRARDIDATVAAHATLAMIIWIPRWMKRRGRLTPDAVAQDVSTLALNALFV